jgi:hypothetical protein
MQAWPAKGKLVKLAKACLPRPRAEQPFGRVTTVTLAIQVAAQIRRFRISALAAQPHSRDLYPVRSRAFL